MLCIDCKQNSVQCRIWKFCSMFGTESRLRVDSDDSSLVDNKDGNKLHCAFKGEIVSKFLHINVLDLLIYSFTLKH